MHLRVVTFLPLLTLCFSAPAAAQSYQPLDTGLRWVYGSPDGVDRDTIVVIGPTIFDGVEVIELRYHGFNDGLSNFWTVDPDGSVLFHGFDRPAESFAVHYAPAIRFVNPPLTEGHSWRDTTFAHCTGTVCDTNSTIFVSTVSSVGPRTVPAGTFVAAAIELGIGSPQLTSEHPSDYSVTGTRTGASNHPVTTQGGETRWWTEGVGMIENYDGWVLLKFDSPTGTRVSSWGRLKTRYR
jgi:hypothetical protein